MFIYDLLDFAKNYEKEYNEIVDSVKFDLGGIRSIELMKELSSGEFYELPFENCLFEITDDQSDSFDKYYILASDKNDSISAKCFIKYKSGKFTFADYELFIDKKTKEVFHISLNKKCFIDLIERVIPEYKHYRCSPIYVVNKYRDSALKAVGLELRANEISQVEAEHDLLRTQSEMIKLDREIAYTVITMLIKSVEIFSCSNVHLQRNNADVPVGRKISDSGNLPQFSYHTVHIKTNKESTERSVGGGNKHASPRLHLRRGHIRRLQSGVKVWVSSCLVGDKNKGIIMSDYKVAA